MVGKNLVNSGYRTLSRSSAMKKRKTWEGSCRAKWNQVKVFMKTELIVSCMLKAIVVYRKKSWQFGKYGEM